MLSLDEPPAAVTSRIVLESKSRVAVPMADDAVSLAFLHEQVYVPTKISVIVNFLEESGVAAEQVLAGTRLRSSTLHELGTRTSMHELLEVIRNAMHLYPGSDLGLQLGLRTHVSSQGMFGYALLCASSWRNAYQTAFKYHQIDSPLMNISWIEEHDVAIAQVPAWQDFNLPQLSHERYVLVRDMQVATIFTTTLDVMGPWSRPLQILLNGPEPAHAPAIRQAFQCPVFFNQSRNELHYPRHWLDRAPRFSNPITAIQMSETCSRLLEEFRWKAGVTWRVHQLLTREPGKFPSLEAVADALFMTSRTLRRHLSQEGTSYSDLLNGIRRSLAIDYLTTTPLSTEDIAATLGFADSASFRHAFKRWTGKTPAGYR